MTVKVTFSGRSVSHSLIKTPIITYVSASILTPLIGYYIRLDSFIAACSHSLDVSKKITALLCGWWCCFVCVCVCVCGWVLWWYVCVSVHVCGNRFDGSRLCIRDDVTRTQLCFV